MFKEFSAVIKRGGKLQTLSLSYTDRKGMSKIVRKNQNTKKYYLYNPIASKRNDSNSSNSTTTDFIRRRFNTEIT